MKIHFWSLRGKLCCSRIQYNWSQWYLCSHCFCFCPFSRWSTTNLRHVSSMMVPLYKISRSTWELIYSLLLLSMHLWRNHCIRLGKTKIGISGLETPHSPVGGGTDRGPLSQKTLDSKATSKTRSHVKDTSTPFLANTNPNPNNLPISCILHLATKLINVHSNREGSRNGARGHWLTPRSLNMPLSCQ